MMDEMNKAIGLAMKRFKEEFGENATLKEGEQFVTVFNNCTLVLEIEGGEFKIQFLGSKPYKVDYTVDIFEE